MCVLVMSFVPFVAFGDQRAGARPALRVVNGHVGRPKGLLELWSWGCGLAAVCLARSEPGAAFWTLLCTVVCSYNFYACQP